VDLHRPGADAGTVFFRIATVEGLGGLTLPFAAPPVKIVSSGAFSKGVQS